MIRLIAALVGLLAPLALAQEPFVVDFFPEGERIHHTIQLRFIGPEEGEIVDTRLVVRFRTADGFDAADLQLALIAPSGDGAVFVEGDTLGWFGEGEFEADVHFDDLDGQLVPALWGFEVQSVLDPPAYSGTFIDSRWEVTIQTDAEPCEADVDLDGTVTLRDLRRFRELYELGDLTADWNGDGQIDLDDVRAYLSDFRRGRRECARSHA